MNKILMTCNIWMYYRNDGTEFGGSIYQKVNDKLETAVNLAWTAGNSNTRFGIAAKYQMDSDASFSVSRIWFHDNNGLESLPFQRQLLFEQMISLQYLVNTPFSYFTELFLYQMRYKQVKKHWEKRETCTICFVINSGS